MVKKGTKRKTRWRTLSIGDGGTETPDTGITEIKQEQNECLTSTSNTNLSTYNRKSSLHTTPFHQRNGDRNHYFRTSDKYPSHQPHTRTQSQEENLHRNTSYSYKRRPYQSASSRYYGNINNKSNPNTNNRPYRQTDTLDNKENTTTKPLFDEADYTRITTPRQDVLFKKGYLSRPKKTITSTDTTMSSSTTVSVVSTEDSGTQSLSPEHFSSTPEIFDPDLPLMYPGFYDENGVFFINPFMPNGFDPYDDQLMMMPYAGSPFSINPSECCNSESTPKPQNIYQKRNSVDSENSPESPSSQNESASSTPAIDDLSNEPSQNEDVPSESKGEGDPLQPMDGEIAPMQFYYPFMYGPPPFSPIDEYNGVTAQHVNSYGMKYNRFKKRKRRPFKYGNSTGVSATTTDYSEDEDSIEGKNCVLGLVVQPNNIEKTPLLTIAQCDDIISRTTLNTNVSEFVPRHLQASPSRTTLNVEVEEFHPRNYAPIVQPKSTTEAADDDSPKDIITKEMSPESRKVRILPRAAPVKYTQPSKTSKVEPEQINAQITPAIDKSSTLNSSISSRDKNDDNVNGVDNNKKIEKLVDPVNTKADLDDKVVMHPKQQENILENVKKTKFKSTRINKSSPRKTNSGPKKNGKIGKGAITNDKCESVTVAANEHPQPIESKPNDVENRHEIDERLEKSNQPTYAQMVGPVAKPKSTPNIAKTEVVVPSIKENIEPATAGELKIVEVVDEIKPALKVETKWQTVRPKGKKKLFSVMCEEEPNDEWNNFDEEKPVEVKELNNVTELKTDHLNATPTADASTESAVSAKVKPPKTDKVKIKLKAKKSQKKIKEKLNNGTSGDENKQSQSITSTPKDDKMRSVNPNIDDLFVGDGHEFFNDIDISNFSFETNPSMFLNAITNITNSGIYTDNSLNGKSNAGFALNNSLKLLNTFDFCKTKENALLKEEEEMVIRVLKSLNETDNQVVEDNIKCCNNIVEDVKICDDVKIQKDISDVVDGENDTHNNDGKKMETVGAETLDVKYENNCNGNAVNKDEEEMNGHRMEEIKISGNNKFDDRQHQAKANPKIEPITNGHYLNETNGEATDVEDTSGHQIDDINLAVDCLPDNVDHPTDKKPEVEPITSGHYLNESNGEAMDVNESKDTYGHRIDDINLAADCLLDKVDHPTDTKPEVEPITNGHYLNESNGEAMDAKDSKDTNGHRIDDINPAADCLLDKVDHHPADTKPKVESITNGHYLNESNGEAMDAKESKDTNGHQLEDINLLDKIDHPTDREPNVETITNGNHSNNKINKEEIDVSVRPVPSEVVAPMNETNDLDVTNVADKIETDMRMIDQKLVDESEENINKDCITNIKSDDEVQSDLSELSDDNDETIVSQSNDYLEYDEIETIREIDVAELADDLQLDDVTDDFLVDNDDKVTIRNDENELKSHNDVKILENEPSQIAFIKNEADLLNTEITLIDIEVTKNQDRIQSPRNSEDSGILDNQDDGRYFSESDNDKTEQIPVRNFPLTEAVSRWLEEKQKEKSPEPVIRLPDDPELSNRIEKSIMSGMHITQFFDGYEDETSEESDTEFEVTTASKNLLSNPLRVLFRKQNDTATSNHSSNGIRKRVAKFNLESDKSSVMVDEPDILEYWENDPMLQSQNSNSNVLNNGQNNSSSDTDLDAYESVYGKTIDYAKLSANIHNDDVFLSNNILNNDKLSQVPINPMNNNSDSSLPHARSLSGKNDTNSNNKNLNCFKPPEICCMLM